MRKRPGRMAGALAYNNNRGADVGAAIGSAVYHERIF